MVDYLLPCYSFFKCEDGFTDFIALHLEDEYLQARRQSS